MPADGASARTTFLANELVGGSLISYQRLLHRNTLTLGRCRQITRIATPFVKANSVSRHIGAHFVTARFSRESLRQAEEDSAMTSPLQVLSHGNSPKPCHAVMYVNSNHSDWCVPVKQDQWVVVLFKFIRMVLVVNTKSAAVFKEDITANCMIHTPLLLISWSTQCMARVFIHRPSFGEPACRRRLELSIY